MSRRVISHRVANVPRRFTQLNLKPSTLTPLPSCARIVLSPAASCVSSACLLFHLNFRCDMLDVGCPVLLLMWIAFPSPFPFVFLFLHPWWFSYVFVRDDGGLQVCVARWSFVVNRCSGSSRLSCCCSSPTSSVSLKLRLRSFFLFQGGLHAIQPWHGAGREVLQLDGRHDLDTAPRSCYEGVAAHSQDLEVHPHRPAGHHSICG